MHDVLYHYLGVYVPRFVRINNNYVNCNALQFVEKITNFVLFYMLQQCYMTDIMSLWLVTIHHNKHVAVIIIASYYYLIWMYYRSASTMTTTNDVDNEKPLIIRELNHLIWPFSFELKNSLSEYRRKTTMRYY